MTTKSIPIPTMVDSHKIEILSNFIKSISSGVGRKPKLSVNQLFEFIRIKKDYDVGDWKKTFNLCKEIHPDWVLPVYHNCLSSLYRLFVYLNLLVNTILLVNRQQFLNQNMKVVFIDSTCIPVCHILRSSRHKTMLRLAEYSKSTMGWYYGIKLHCIMDYQNNPIYFTFTNAKTDDRQVLKQALSDKKLFYDTNTMFVADKGYQAKWLEELAKETQNYLITGKRKSKTTNTLASWFDMHLLHNRARIETIFSKLKTNYNLTSTKARSEFGYFFNTIFALFSLLTS